MEPESPVWYPRPELNWDPRFRKPLLYPFELRERASRKNTPAAANGKRAISLFRRRRFA
jgi:hypothetical protein